MTLCAVFAGAALTGLDVHSMKGALFLTNVTLTQSTGKHLRRYEHGRYRADQSAFRDELLGYGARPPPMCHVWQAREYAGFSPALACGPDARGAQNHFNR